MHLNNTQKLINTKIKNADFNSYAILVKNKRRRKNTHHPKHRRKHAF